MVDRRVARRQALLDALMPAWREREAALAVLAAKEIAVVGGRAGEPPTSEDRERFERAQADVERALKRLQWFDYRHVAPVLRTHGARTAPSRSKTAAAVDRRDTP